MAGRTNVLAFGALLVLIGALVGVIALDRRVDEGVGKSEKSKRVAPVEGSVERPDSQSLVIADQPAEVILTSLSPLTGPELEQLSVEALVARAGKGDARAACRAAFWLSDCASLKEFPPERLSIRLGEFEVDADMDKDTKNANLWAGMQVDMLESAERCKAVKEASFSHLAALLRQSALTGNRGAMLKYASGEFLGSSPGLEATRQPGFADWRAEALPMALASLRAGSLEAAFALYRAYESDEGALEGVVPDNPVEAQVYRQLFHLAQGEATYQIATLTPAQNELALKRARILHRQIFAGVLAKKEASVLGPTWQNSQDQGAVDPCQ